MRQFCDEGLNRKFRARYNPNTQTVWVDRAVVPLPDTAAPAPGSAASPYTR
jgi:hypothetical protein